MHSGMQVLGLMISTFHLLNSTQGPCNGTFLWCATNPICLWTRWKGYILRQNSLSWWLLFSAFSAGNFFLPLQWKIVKNHVSILSWGRVLGPLAVQGCWTQEESMAPINILELQAILLLLVHLTLLLSCHLVQIHSDNATTVAYINHQGVSGVLQWQWR